MRVIIEQAGLEDSFDGFYRVLLATTVSASDGGRRVLQGSHAIALSEATSTLYGALKSALNLMRDRHGVPATAMPAGIAIQGAHSPDGPWHTIPAADINISRMEIGGAGCSALLMAAIDSATRVAAFPVSRWNELQAARPGADHQRFHTGDLISDEDLEVLESAARLMDLVIQDPAAAKEASGQSPADTERLTVSQAAKLLCSDIPGLSHSNAKARVSQAANRGSIRTNGKTGIERRIDRDSLSTWRLEQRDKDLDSWG